MVNLNYTPFFDPISDEVHVNISQSIANQPLQMTTQWIWIIFALVSLALLIYSVKHHEDSEGDICGILSSIFLALTSWQAFAVDTVTGYGASAVCEDTSCRGQEFVLLESHQIYHYDVLGYIYAMIFIISIANLIWLWLDYRRISNQTTETLDHKGIGKPKPDPSKESGPKPNN